MQTIFAQLDVSMIALNQMNEDNMPKKSKLQSDKKKISKQKTINSSCKKFKSNSKSLKKRIMALNLNSGLQDSNYKVHDYSNAPSCFLEGPQISVMNVEEDEPLLKQETTECKLILNRPRANSLLTDSTTGTHQHNPIDSLFFEQAVIQDSQFIADD
jgi:hypothetical protein